MRTILRSAGGEEVAIGPDEPFLLIGERINPTGRKALAAELLARDFSRVQRDAIAQVAAGARVLDINAGLGVANANELEPEIMVAAIEKVQAVVDVPLSIDSSVVGALRSGLAAARGKPLVNSVTGEDERMEAVFPLVAQYHAAVIVISNDENGVSMDPRVRFEVASRVVRRAETYGIPREDLLIDPLVMPAGAVRGSGRSVLQILRWIADDLGCNTVCGASNVSFGLPGRETINATFLAMVMAAGMGSAITNPLIPEVRQAILAADMLLGRDADCLNWLRFSRGQANVQAPGAPASPEDDRAARRAARRAERGS